MATLRFQPTQRHAWLVDLDETGSRTQGDLCFRHAEALVLPRGWELHDERSEVGRRRVAEPWQAAAGPAVPRRKVRVPRRPQPAAESSPSQFPGFEPDPVPVNGNGSGSTPLEVAPLEVAVAFEPPVEIIEPPVEPIAVPVEVVVEREPEPEPEVAREAEPEAEADAAPAVAARTIPEQFGANDDDVDDEALGAILDARTPLLQRAFRNAKPRG